MSPVVPAPVRICPNCHQEVGAKEVFCPSCDQWLPQALSAISYVDSRGQAGRVLRTTGTGTPIRTQLRPQRSRRRIGAVVGVVVAITIVVIASWAILVPHTKPAPLVVIVPEGKLFGVVVNSYNNSSFYLNGSEKVSGAFEATGYKGPGKVWVYLVNATDYSLVGKVKNGSHGYANGTNGVPLKYTWSSGNVSSGKFSVKLPYYVNATGGSSLKLNHWHFIYVSPGSILVYVRVTQPFAYSS